MSIDDKMTIDERRKYLRKMQERYVQADRKERGQLLDEMEAVTGLHRKSLIRLMGGSLVRQPRRQQRDRTYGPDVDDALRVIAESTDYICAERLTPNLPWLAQHLAAHGELTISSRLLEQLACISVSTVERIDGHRGLGTNRSRRRRTAEGPLMVCLSGTARSSSGSPRAMRQYARSARPGSAYCLL
jgi:hypothetical protein